MKATFLTAALATASLTAVAQGKINLINDSASLVMYSAETSRLLPPDVALAGQPVGNAVLLPSGITLEAGLYGGTSSSQLFLYSTVLLNNTAIPAGNIPATHIVLNAQPNGAPAIPGIASGTAIGPNTPWFQVRVWDSAYSSFEAALARGTYIAEGPLFQMNPGPSIAYTFTSPPSVNSTWIEAPFSIPIPEPSPAALAAAGGFAWLLAFYKRRR